MKFDRALAKFGEEPDIVGLVPSLKELSLKELKEIPFPMLNELLKTNFPAGSNGESHKLLFDAIQRTVTTSEMQIPLELILRSDGLWIRVCSGENATLYPEALELAAKFYLNEDRISHSFCPECATKQKAMFKKVYEKRQTTKQKIFDLTIPASEISAVAIEEKTD